MELDLKSPTTKLVKGTITKQDGKYKKGVEQPIPTDAWDIRMITTTMGSEHAT